MSPDSLDILFTVLVLGIFGYGCYRTLRRPWPAYAPHMRALTLALLLAQQLPGTLFAFALFWELVSRPTAAVILLVLFLYGLCMLRLQTLLFRRFFRCPRCAEPLPLHEKATDTDFKLPAQCPTCGTHLEKP